MAETKCACQSRLDALEKRLAALEEGAKGVDHSGTTTMTTGTTWTPSFGFTKNVKLSPPEVRA